MNSKRLFLPVGGTGGGSTDKPFSIDLWRYILSQLSASKSPRRVALLLTPSKLSGVKINIDSLIANYRVLESELNCEFTILDEEKFGSRNYSLDFDVLCITCGNTAGARELWQIYGCEKTILNWYQSGVLITGYSAGFIFFYEWASTDSVPGPAGDEFGIMPGMGIIKGAAIPHADTQPNRIPDFQKVIASQSIEPAIALGEEVLAMYINEQLVAVVSPVERPAAAWVSSEVVTSILVEQAKL